MADVEMASGPPPALPPRPASGSNSREPSTSTQPASLHQRHSGSYDPNGKARQPYNSSSLSQPDLYAADRARSQCSYIWYRWFNPWVRWLTIFVILYLYALSSGVLTYRGNTFQVRALGHDSYQLPVCCCLLLTLGCAACCYSVFRIKCRL